MLNRRYAKLALLSVFACTVPLHAQDTAPATNVRISSTGLVGITAGQTAQLNVVNPGVPAPLLGILCSGDISLVDDHNTIIASTQAQLLEGRSVSLSINADTDVTLPDSGRLELRGVVRTPSLTVAGGPCPLLVTLEVIANDTSRTQVVLSGVTVFPVSLIPPPLQH